MNYPATPDTPSLRYSSASDFYRAAISAIPKYRRHFDNPTKYTPVIAMNSGRAKEQFAVNLLCRLAGASLAVTLTGCALQGNGMAEYYKRVAAERQVQNQAMATRVQARPLPLDTTIKLGKTALVTIDLPAEGTEPATQARLFAGCNRSTLAMDYRREKDWSSPYVLPADPARNIAKATRSVIWRIGVFYLLSIFVVISVVPWNDPLLASVGSYQRALEIMNIPHAKFMVDVVVLIAVASCMNSSIYIASRMLFSLGRRGDAPKMLKATSSEGVPRAAVIASTVIGASITVWSYFMPAGLFQFLLASSGAIALLVYLAIAVSQLRMRRILQQRNVELTFRMWLFPWLTWLVIVFICAALAVMMITPEHRTEVTTTIGLALAISFIGLVTSRHPAPAARVTSVG